LNNKNKKTLKAILEDPIRSDIRWSDIESLIEALGGVITQGNGARVRFRIGDIAATIHRPHPKSEINKAGVKDLRVKLKEWGIDLKE
jgi:hypothetical protein